MDFEKYSQAILSGRNAEALKKLADSENGRKVAGMLNEDELVKAAKGGDGASLANALKNILSTPQGQALADEVRKAVKP